MFAFLNRLFGVPKPASVPVIGTITEVRQAGDVVYAKGRFYLETERGREAYQLLKQCAGTVDWTPNRPRHDSGYHKSASTYLMPAHADSQVSTVLRALCDGRQLTSLDVEKLLREQGNLIIDGGRALRHCKAICEASGCVLQEKTVTVGSGKRVKLRWLNLTDRSKLRSIDK